MAYQRSGSNPSSDKGLLHNINVVLIQHRWRTGAMPPPPRLCGKMTTGVNLAKRLADGKSTKAESHAGLLSSHFFFFLYFRSLVVAQTHKFEMYTKHPVI